MKSRWRFTDAVASWSWKGCEGRKADIEVFSDADTISLYLNGKRIGRKKVKDYRACFCTKYYPGILTAVACDAEGKEISRTNLRTAGTDTKVAVRADKSILKANGQDLCHIAIALTDENSIIKTAEDVVVTVEINGSAVLMGVGSALCKTDEILNGDSHTTNYGRALAIVRAGYESGTVFVKVKTERFGEAEMVIEVE